MMIVIYFLVGLFVNNLVSARIEDLNDVTRNDLNETEPDKLRVFDLLDFLEQVKFSKENDTVLLQVYYESFCPFCVQFFTGELKTVIETLGQYIDIRTYPYGNAKTIIDENGKYKIECQHGPAECYGNKLHACALDLLQNKTEALIFNSCLMTRRKNTRGSDDKAADACGTELNVDSNKIKECAKGNKGDELLKYYGDESKKANFHYVPYILVQGRVNDRGDLIKDICSVFVNPPPPCKDTESVK
ncbi:PREDICTED: gamma-interferon-inducible lysosomal thiol reductase-like [Papilio polytes]|uniref:gamma-interferon-inducible lysosomal thiol reductase-like n=1 Tax=Papilio polytes TaxID=76194 RepID=UPI0006766066|nr:PREDICTED: gamma-interferon-inducible lysosomal thiol reductase-like [Papilio polytes]